MGKAIIHILHRFFFRAIALILLLIPVINYAQFNGLGSKDADIIRQQNYDVMKMHGYQPPVIPPSDPYQLHQFIINQYNNQNDNSNQNKSRELAEILKEAEETDSRYSNSSTAENPEIIQPFKKAFLQVNDMLIGKSKLSFINATYYTESAYGNAYLDYSKYQNTITESAEFIKRWLKENNLPLHPQNIHYAIQQFMGNTISIKVLTDDKKGFKTITHSPFKYDYEDYDGKKDFRNYFSTKCLATGTGQCNSMPMVYLQLCEALGIKGYLTLAPFHSFIKYKNKDGKVINYEPTSHWTLSDKWYQENLAITQKAKMNGIYLDTLNKKQTVANSLIDLAISYMLKTNTPDTTFIQTCLNTAQKYFPRKNNLSYYLAKSSLLSRQLISALKQHGAKDISEAKNYADTNYYYKKLQQNEAVLSELGYQELPQTVYDEMIEHQKNKTNAPDAKTKKSLFITN